MVLIDPMENGAQGNEGSKRGGELIIAGGDAAMTLEGREEVFHEVPFAVVASMERTVFFAGGVEGQAGKDIVCDQQLAQRIGIVTFVGDQRAAVALGQLCHQGRSHGDVGDVARTEQQEEGTPLAVDQSVDLRRQATPAEANGLRGSTALGIESAVMDADVACIDKPQAPAGLLRQSCEQTRPQTQVAPACEVAIDGTPRDRRVRQITPRTTGAEDIKQGDHHLFQRCWGPSSSFSFLPKFTRLWQLYAGRASAPDAEACD